MVSTHLNKKMVKATTGCPLLPTGGIAILNLQWSTLKFFFQLFRLNQSGSAAFSNSHLTGFMEGSHDFMYQTWQNRFQKKTHLSWTSSNHLNSGFKFDQFLHWHRFFPYLQEYSEWHSFGHHSQMRCEISNHHGPKESSFILLQAGLRCHVCCILLRSYLLALNHFSMCTLVAKDIRRPYISVTTSFTHDPRTQIPWLCEAEHRCNGGSKYRCCCQSKYLSLLAKFVYFPRTMFFSLVWFLAFPKNAEKGSSSSLDKASWSTSSSSGSSSSTGTGAVPTAHKLTTVKLATQSSKDI